MKNTHLNHVEDLIFLSSPEKALWWLKEGLTYIDESRHSHLEFSIKWDGAPAFVCGTNPSNGKFFVGTKAVFNKKEPKIAETWSEVERLYGLGGVSDKLKYVLEAGQYGDFVPPNRIFQGDFLFDAISLHWESPMGYNFKPNTLRYSVGNHAHSLGLVFHTEYLRSLEDPEARFIVDTRDFPDRSEGPSRAGNIRFFKSHIDRKYISGRSHHFWGEYRLLAQINLLVDGLKNSTLDFIRSNPRIQESLSNYINQCVRETVDPSGANFLSYLTKLYIDWAGLLKTEKYKLKKREELIELLDNLRVQDLDVMFLIHILMANLKEQIIKRFDIMTPKEVDVWEVDMLNRNTQTQHEGYVASSRTSGFTEAVKFVNRKRFSRLNMISTKEWQHDNS